MATLSESDVLSSCKVSDIEDVSELIAINKNIRCIRILRRCNSLQKVDLTKNEIEDGTPLKNCKKMTWLSLAKNRLTVMDFVEKLTKLTVLNLSFNQITDMSPIKPLRQLRALILSGNCITKVKGLEEMTQLNTLVLSQNKITTIDVAFLGSLSKLQLSHNQLNQFPDTKFNECLKHLSLNDNLIEVIPSSCLDGISLEILDMGKNKIRSFKDIKPLKRLKTLKQLNLKGNELCEHKSYLKKMLKKFPQLKTFDSVPIKRILMKLNEDSLPESNKKRPVDNSLSSADSDCDQNSPKKHKKLNNSSPKETSTSTDTHNINTDTKPMEQNRKKSVKKKKKDTKAKSGVISIKEVKTKKSLTGLEDLLSTIQEGHIGQGDSCSWSQ